MALESFYGGKQGISPVIKARFKYESTEDEAYQARLKPGHQTKLTKEEATWLNDALNVNIYVAGNFVTWTPELLKPFTMNECFKDPNYKDVWYGELCIIDTDNKLNPNNGNLYRRTLRQATLNNKYLYAEYIGQIVGPSGGIPNFDFGSLDAERGKAVGTVATYSTEQAPLDNSSWEYSYPKEENNNITITTEVPDNKDSIAVLSAAQPGGNEANIQMVPGKQGNTYNDTIRYTWCNVRRKLDGKDDDAWVYLGFEIPYTIYDAQGREENYTYNGDVFIDNSDSNHPFYKQYDFHIPRGTRGIGPEELFVVGKNGRSIPAGYSLYPFDSIQYQQNPQINSVLDINKVDIKDKFDWYYIPDGTISVTPSEKTYWVVKWGLYNPKTTAEQKFYLYVAPYKDIKEVRLQNNGELDIQYSDSDNWVSLNTLTWIISANVNIDSADNNYGQFQINFNNEIIPDIDTNLHLIQNMNYDDSTGEITFNYSGNVEKTVGTIEYINSLIINTDKNDNNNYGKVTGETNIGNSSLIAILPLIEDTIYDPTSGEITFKYSNDLNITPTNKISYISKMKFLEDGTLQYQLNNETGNSWHNITDATGTKLQIKDIKSTSIRNDGHLYITYRNDEEVDLGLVRGNTIAGVVYTLESERSDKSFSSKESALEDLRHKTYSTSASTTIGGDNDGRIKVNNSNVTGGLVIATIKEQENSEEFYSVLFYYNNNLHVWQSAGIVGNTGSGSGQGNSNIYIQTKTTAYPEEDAINPQIYFVDGTANNASALDKTFAMEDFAPWVFNE